MTKTFWRGEGYLLDPAHGGLIHHYSVPKFVISEVERFGFTIKEVQGDDYPALAEFILRGGITTSFLNLMLLQAHKPMPPLSRQLQHQTKS